MQQACEINVKQLDYSTLCGIAQYIMWYSTVHITVQHSTLYGIDDYI